MSIERYIRIIAGSFILISLFWRTLSVSTGSGSRPSSAPTCFSPALPAGA